MSRVSNKKIEKRYFEMFCQDYPLPKGVVVYGDKPDVIIKGPKNIGIEITNFYFKDGSLGESEQKQQVLREIVVKNAQNLYMKNDGKGITISFDFDKEKPIKNKKNLEKKLAEYAKSIENQEEGSMALETFKEIPELSFVYLQQSTYLDGRWRVSRVYRGQTMLRGRLLEIVRGKEGKVAKYKECDAYWLVIVVDFFDPAQDQEILIRDFEKIKSEKFEKILVYKTAFGHILEAK